LLRELLLLQSVMPVVSMSRRPCENKSMKLLHVMQQQLVVVVVVPHVMQQLLLLVVVVAAAVVD
jgi:hypothetical protein